MEGVRTVVRPSQLTINNNHQSDTKDTPSPSRETIVADTRRVLDEFLRRRFRATNNYNQPSVYRTYLDGISHQSSTQSYSQSAPVHVLRRHKSHEADGVTVAAGRIDTTSIEHTTSKPTTSTQLSTESSSSQEQKTLTKTPVHGSDAGPSSSTSNERKHEVNGRPRVKKSYLKRAKERLQQSIRRKTVTPKKRKGFSKTGSLTTGTKSQADTVKRSASDSTSKLYQTRLHLTDPLATPRAPPRRKKRFLERLRSLGNQQPSKTSTPSGSTAHIPTKRQRSFSKPWTELSDGWKSFKSKVGQLSPKKERRALVADKNIDTIRKLSNLAHEKQGLEQLRENGVKKEGAKTDTPLSPTTAIGGLSIATGGQNSQPSSNTSSQKSSQSPKSTSIERLDALFAGIARRLDYMAEEFMFDKATAARMQAEEFEHCQLEETQLSDLELDVYKAVKSEENRHKNNVQALAESENLDHFERIMTQVTEDAQPDPQQNHQRLALVFGWTLAAISCVGEGSLGATRLANYCVDYVGNKFASWLIERGGWMSVVEDSSCNELD